MSSFFIICHYVGWMPVNDMPKAIIKLTALEYMNPIPQNEAIKDAGK